MIVPNNMMMMHYGNYDGAYGYDLISLRLYHPLFWGSMLLAHYYRNYIDDDYEDDNDVDLLYDGDDEVDVDFNDDYACGSTFGS